MTKVEFASIYAMISAVMMVFMLYIGKDADKKGKHVRRQLHMIFVMVTLYLISFFINDIRILEINHCVVSMCESWTLFLFVHFALFFTDSNIKIKRGLSTVFALLVLADSAMLIANAITVSFFNFRAVVMTSTSVYVYPIINGWYLFHYACGFLCALMFIFIMVRKAITVSSLYKSRYRTLSILTAVGTLVILLIRLWGNYLNFASVIILSAGECVIFYVYFHLPKIKFNQLKNYVIKNVTLPILMFDYEDELQVINEPAKNMVDLKLGTKLQDYVATNNLKFILTPERRAEGKTKEFTLTLKDDGSTYLIHGQELWDEKQNFVGTLLVYNDITKQEKLKDEATYHATRDRLTGLYNREYFLEMAKNLLDADENRQYAIIVSDIQQFKMFNEILGRKLGDDLLISIAEGYRRRQKEDWLFSRVAGDKFAMIMPKEDYNEERFVKICKSVIEEREYALTVHFNIGVYFTEDRKITVSEMCDRAYIALESVKGNIQQNVAYFDDAMRTKMINETTNVSELEKALREEEFAIFLQPQMDTVNNKIVGCEALARWISPSRGLIPPMDFVPAFEENGMIFELDYCIWELACKTLRRWKDKGDTTSVISVNISAKDFYLSDIFSSLTGLVEKYEISPKNLHLEITETAFVLNVTQQMALVKKLQGYGFIIEIDDFGSGYSSLNNLKNFEVDVLKLDLKFFEKTENNNRAEKIIETVVNLAYNLKMQVIAEGVEEQEQVELLQQIGCNVVQGYYYAKPMPVEEYEEFAKKYK